MAEVAERGVVVEVCPTSNLRTRAQLVACTRIAATAGSAPAALIERTLADLAVVEREHVGA